MLAPTRFFYNHMQNNINNYVFSEKGDGKCPTVKYEEHLIVLRVDKNAVKFSDVINFFFLK